MLVTSSVEFNQETLDTSIENYIRLNYSDSRTENLIFYVITKHLIKYLKDHPQSRICEDVTTIVLLYKLKDMCYNHARTQSLQEIREFTTNKKLELDLKDDKFPIRKSTLFDVWFYIDTILEQLEIRRETINYGL